MKISITFSFIAASLLAPESLALESSKPRGLKGSKKGAKVKKGKKNSGFLAVDCAEAETKKPMAGANPCAESKINIENSACMVEGVVEALGQAGADVTVGYKGQLDMDGREPVTQPYWMQGICPVNVHWHLGAEHRSEGEYDENGTGPDMAMDEEHRALAGDARLGLRCGLYDEEDAKFTDEYDWKHCVGMHVGETYEVHWPHSLAGACGTVNQFQTPFYDGVFCNAGRLNLEILEQHVGVQAQVFTIVNDEDYYFPNLMNGMIVDESLGMGGEITKYTGSTTGTSRNNEICSNYAPITWQVDRKCHMVSASTFDKMCADMKTQRDDMSDDLYAHGSRELVTDELAADNQVNRKLSNFVYY